jgi:hypothetical protein
MREGKQESEQGNGALGTAVLVLGGCQGRGREVGQALPSMWLETSRRGGTSSTFLPSLASLPGTLLPRRRREAASLKSMGQNASVGSFH